MKSCAHDEVRNEDAACAGWCQFGSSEGLPRNHNQKAYLATDSALPD